MQIRIAEAGDAAAIAAIYAPVVRDTVISFETEPPSAAEMASRIKSTLKTHPWLVAEEDGCVLAYTYANLHRSRAAYRWACDVSVYVGDNARRRGIGRLLYARLFDFLVRQGLHIAYAGITLPNPASVGLHESIGFEPVGIFHDVGYKNGAWQDVGWWRCKLQVLEENPSEPIPFSTLRQSLAESY